MNNTVKQQTFVIALSFIGMMFFTLGFALGINSFLIPVLSSSLQISSGASYLLIGATFSTFIIFGYPATLTIRRIGYKKTMSLSFLIFAAAFAIYIFSTQYLSFHLFLLASFVSGIGNTFLQAAVNPYVTIIGPIDSAARRMSIMGICNKLAWPVAPVFLAWIVGKDVMVTQVTDLYLPFCIVIGVFVVLGLISMLAPLPEVKAVGEDDDAAHDCAYASKKSSIWQFPHLLLGVLALFLYVGVETVALSTLVDYASAIGLENAPAYAWISSIGMTIGYIFGIILIPKYLSQAGALRICAWLGIVGTITVVFVPTAISIWLITLLAMGCSLMWPALWPLAMTDLGKFTKAGSSLMVMAMAGGAVLPLLFGLFKDLAGAQNAYIICLPCFIYILYYGTKGYKIRS